MAHRLGRELNVALNAVSTACTLCRRVQQSLVAAVTLAKNDRSPVTVADYGSQVLITLALKELFPLDPVVAEEESSLLRKEGDMIERVRGLLVEQGVRVGREALLQTLDIGTTDAPQERRFWAVDPIDGTKGFLRGGQYAVALALIEEGEVVLGVLGCPNYARTSFGAHSRDGLLAFAVKGEGAFVRSLSGAKTEEISCDDIGQWAMARLCEPVEADHADHGLHAEIARSLGMAMPPLRMDSQCKYTAVASGDASIYLRLPKDSTYQEAIWDHAAGSIIVTEAGGRVSDIHGLALDFSAGRFLRKNRGIVATNGRLHQDLLRAVAMLPPWAGSEFQCVSAPIIS